MNLKFTQNSIIGSKLQKNTVRLILAAIFVTAIPLIVLFSNSKIKNSLNQLNVIGSQTTQQLDLEATNIIAYAKLIPTDKQLSALIAESNPADKVKIENKLMELSGIGANIQNIIINTSEEVYHSVFLTDEEAQSILSSDWYTSLYASDFIRFFYYDQNGQLYFCIRLDDISALSGEMILLIRPENFASIMTGADKTFSHYLWLNNQNTPVINCNFSDNEYAFLSKQLQGDQKTLFLVIICFIIPMVFFCPIEAISQDGNLWPLYLILNSSENLSP